MGHSENLRSYLNMTRKELQQLCKKHNIPANRSHAFLAKSLASLYMKKNIKSAFSEEEKLSPSLSSKRKVTEKTPSIEKTQGSYARLLPSEGNIHNQLKFFCTTSSEKPQINMNVVHPSTGNNRSSNSSTSNLGNLGANYPDAADIQKTNANQLLGFVGNEFGRRNECKRSSELRNSNQFLQNAFTVSRTCNNAVAQCGHNEVLKCTTESGIRSASETSTKTPSFQFFVMSEAGINLYVDLESNPIEWINSLKDEVCIQQKGGNHESSAHTCGLPHADDNVENLPSGDTRMELQNNEVEQNPGCANSALSSVVSENGNSEAYPPDVTIATSGSSVLIPGNPPADFGCLEENQAVSSSHYAHLAHENLTTDIARSHGVVCVHECNDASTVAAKSDASLCDTPLKAISNVDDVTIDCPTKTTCSDYGDVEASALSNSSHYMSAKSNLSDELKNSLENSHVGSIKNQNGGVEELISKSPMSEKRDKECTHGASSNLCQFADHNVLNGATTNAQSEVCSTPTRGKDSDGARAESSLNNNCKRSITSEILKELPSKRHKMSCENMNGTLVHLKGTKNLAKETISDAVVNPRRSTRLVPK